MKKRGKGMSLVLHPTGNKGAGDPSQAAIVLRSDGTFTLIVGAADIGQGSNTILRQFAADELDVPIENITVNNSSGNIAPICRGSYASRVTLIDPHAVKKAADRLKAQIAAWGASQFNVDVDKIVIADNKISVKDDPEKTMTMAEVGNAVPFLSAEFFIGAGGHFPADGQAHDEEDGKMTAVAAISFGSCVVEIDVDTETGVVDILKVAQSWELGKAVNPLMVKMQMNGSLSCGLGWALGESYLPYAPTEDFAVDSLGDYYIPTFADYPQEAAKCSFAEVPSAAGVQGAKGFSEGGTSVVIPAIVDAIHDAIGVWMTKVPITPEDILKALEE